MTTTCDRIDGEPEAGAASSRRYATRSAFPVAIALFCAFASIAHAGSAFPGASWATPESTGQPSGWSREGLKLADDYAESIRTDAYLVVDRGVLVHSYGEIDKPMNLASIRKSVISILYGINAERGKIDLDQSIGDLGITDKGGLSDIERTATVRQLLQARSGVYHEAAYETPDAKRLRPERGSHAPGTYWYYNNWDFNVLGTIFQLRTGKTVFEALNIELAQPLRFQDFRYPKDTEFVRESSSDHPAYTMYLSARDLARVGLLVSRGGEWDGRQIVSQEWLAESTKPYSLVPPGWSGYGYLWWVPVRAFPKLKYEPQQLVFAIGDGGQFMLIDRKRDIVIVNRVNNNWLWLKRNRVDVDQFARLVYRIMDAAPIR